MQDADSTPKPYLKLVTSLIQLPRGGGSPYGAKQNFKIQYYKQVAPMGQNIAWFIIKSLIMAFICNEAYFEEEARNVYF